MDPAQQVHREADTVEKAGGEIPALEELDPGVPPPVLLNPWKHHAGAIRARIDDLVRQGAPALLELPSRLRSIGDSQMDLYLGPLSPAEIGREIVARLEHTGQLDPAVFAAWLEAQGGFATLELSDGSRWILRWGRLPGRHVHVHPGRYSPHTRRVRANLLKVAIATLAWAGIHRLEPRDAATVNQARCQVLGLSPVPRVGGDGVGALIAVLEEDRSDGGPP